MLASEAAKQKLMSFIKENNYKIGDKLPPASWLAENLKVSRLTLREAIGELRNMGLIRPIQGKGTFVMADISLIKDSLNSNIGITDMIRSGGYMPGTKYFKKELGTADRELALQLDINEGDTVVVCTRVRTADGTPAVYSEDYLAPHIVPGFLAITDENTSIFKFIEENENIRRGVTYTEIRPVKADKQLAGLLEIKTGDLLMEFLVTVRDEEGRPLVWAHEYLKPEFFRFIIHR